jgi:hypothetical protein
MGSFLLYFLCLFAYEKTNVFRRYRKLYRELKVRRLRQKAITEKNGVYRKGSQGPERTTEPRNKQEK